LKFAAIDIGSNAARIQVSKVIGYPDHFKFKKLEYVRFPLRLGEDVFRNHDNRIGQAREKKFMELMEIFRLLLNLYEVDDYLAVATSAMREAPNGEKITENIRSRFNINLEVISGAREAEIINEALVNFLDKEPHLHVDVGGGSTELNVYVAGDKVAAESFMVGSVRNRNVPARWEQMQEWVKQYVKKEHGKVKVIGTGGNITKLYDLADRKIGKNLSVYKIKEIRNYVNSHTMEERINKLMLNPDRADVIVPASDIYLHVMQWVQATKILVPDVGLKDGILTLLLNKHRETLNRMYTDEE
jgi:exopolyphosphatase / guanosine-5'-triphosphate,3'-diphosphate pyrophosphatase